MVNYRYHNFEAKVIQANSSTLRISLPKRQIVDKYHIKRGEVYTFCIKVENGNNHYPEKKESGSNGT